MGAERCLAGSLQNILLLPEEYTLLVQEKSPHSLGCRSSVGCAGPGGAEPSFGSLRKGYMVQENKVT